MAIVVGGGNHSSVQSGVCWFSFSTLVQWDRNYHGVVSIYFAQRGLIYDSGRLFKFLRRHRSPTLPRCTRCAFSLGSVFRVHDRISLPIVVLSFMYLFQGSEVVFRVRRYLVQGRVRPVGYLHRVVGRRGGGTIILRLGRQHAFFLLLQ